MGRTPAWCSLAVGLIVVATALLAHVALAALRAEPHIEHVAIETPDGRTFARYLRQGLTIVPPRPPAFEEDVHFGENRVSLRHAIVSEGNLVGRLYLQSDLQERSSRVRRYLTITGIILCVSLIGGLVIATRLQRNISEPILQLVEAARTVSAVGING